MFDVVSYVSTDCAYHPRTIPAARWRHVPSGGFSSHAWDRKLLRQLLFIGDTTKRPVPVSAKPCQGTQPRHASLTVTWSHFHYTVVRTINTNCPDRGTGRTVCRRAASPSTVRCNHHDCRDISEGLCWVMIQGIVRRRPDAPSTVGFNHHDIWDMGYI